MKKFLILLWLVVSMSVYGQKFNGLATSPPMGWNSWNRFGCDVDESLIMETADAMVENGMKDAGYQYIVIDDCWHGMRDSLGFIHPHPDHFPSGMKALADYIHSKGLKFGIYSDAGWRTCAGRPGSRGYEYQDALTYAEWGVDYLKYDWCNTEGLNPVGAYLTMRDALYKAGRPIVFSICEWGTASPWEWAKDIGHCWRISGDIAVLFDGKKGHGSWDSWGVLQILDMRNDIRKYAGPDRWNDFDMMEVGNGMTVEEDRAHFSLWCMMASPLMAGNDLRHMSEETQEILTNKEVIAVNQDKLGIQGFKCHQENVWEIWAKPLKGGDLALCFLNRGKESVKIEYNWLKEVIKDDLKGIHYRFIDQEYNVRDLWAKKDIGSTNQVFKRKLKSHDVIMMRLTKK